MEYFDIFEDFVNKAENDFKDIYILGDINCSTMTNSRVPHLTPH